VFLHYQNSPVIYAIVSMAKHGQDKPTQGLFRIPPQLYYYIVQELQGRSIADFDLDFVSNHREVFVLTLQGGSNRLSPEIQGELMALEARLHQPEVHDEIRAASYNRTGGW